VDVDGVVRSGRRRAASVGDGCIRSGRASGRWAALSGGGHVHGAVAAIGRGRALVRAGRRGGESRRGAVVGRPGRRSVQVVVRGQRAVAGGRSRRGQGERLLGVLLQAAHHVGGQVGAGNWTRTREKDSEAIMKPFFYSHNPGFLP